MTKNTTSDRNNLTAVFYKSVIAAICAAGFTAGEIGDRAKDRALGTTPEEMKAICDKKFAHAPAAVPTCLEDNKGSFERAAMAHGALKILSGAGLIACVGSLAFSTRRRREEEPPAP